MLTIEEEMNAIIDELQSHEETYEEIKELIFTEEMLDTEYSIAEKSIIMANFKAIKKNALNNVRKLAPAENLIFSRLVEKHYGLKRPVEDTFREIENELIQNKQQQNSILNNIVNKLKNKQE